jgi:hypothetical protein
MRDTIENQIRAVVIDSEYQIAKANAVQGVADFESMLDMLECVRSEKDYEWMSDIFIPEYPSHVLTASAIDASQYFVNRDFVTAYLQDNDAGAKEKADAAAENINRTLNQDHLFYYQKYMRARIISDMAGQVFARCWWEKQERDVVLGYKEYPQFTGEDIDGNAMEDENEPGRAPRYQSVVRPITGTEPIIDRFNFDILDPRNVFTPPKYAYSVQEMKWITVQFEKTYMELLADQEGMGYVNLDKIKDVRPPAETKTAQESTLKNDDKTADMDSPDKPFDIIERWGQFWCHCTKYDPQGKPVEVEPGIDDMGEKMEGAKLLETVITFAISGSTQVMIRFQLNPYEDPWGKPYKPFVRGLCFIHPTKDGGMGDGIFSKELQKAVNDTFNITMDRTKLAMLPTLKGKKSTMEDNTTVYFAPEHVIEVENPDDLTEFKIEDNIEGGLRMLGLLIDKMQQVKATFPTTMGNIPSESSTTATAVSGAEAKSTTRLNYRSLTHEYTFLTEFYKQINYMTYQFAHRDTAIKLMGKQVFQFDPTKSYMWKPVSQAIETEYSKVNKIKNFLTLLSYIMKVPAMAPVVIKIILEIFKAYGDEYESIVKHLPAMKQLMASMSAAEGGEGNNGGGSPTGQNETVGAPSSQAGAPISEMEGAARTANQDMGA